MATQHRLPTPGSDSGTWGDILNDFLGQAHASDGSLANNVVGASQIQDNAVTVTKLVDGTITATKLAGNIPSTKLDSATQTQLANAGTVADGSITTAKIASGGIAPSAVTGTAVVTADSRLSDQRVPTDGSVTDAKVSSTAAIAKTKLATAVQTSLTSADTAYQKPGAGIPKTDLVTAVQTSLTAADNATPKPAAGVDGKIVQWNNTSGQLVDATTSLSATFAPLTHASRHNIGGADDISTWFAALTFLPINAKSAPYFAQGDGTTDDTVAIQTAMNDAGTSGRDLYIPAGTYITKCGIVHRQGVKAYGAGAAATIIKNTQTTSSFGLQTCWHFGTYGPGSAFYAANNETGYLFNAVSEGSPTITLATSGDASNFTVGSIIMIEGTGTPAYTGACHTPNEMTTVTAVTGAVLSLKHSVTTAYPASSTVRVLNTNTIFATTYQGSVAGGSVPAYALHRGSLSDMTVQATAAGQNAINLACYDSTIRNVHAIGGNAMAGNPCSHSLFEGSQFRYTYEGLEIAYLSQDSVFNNCVWVRTSTAGTVGQKGIWINSGEGARRIRFNNCEIYDYSATTTDATYTVQFSSDCEWRGGKIVGSNAGCSGIFVPSRCVVEGVRLAGHAAHGIDMGGIGSIVKSNYITTTGTSFFAINIGNATAENIVETNVLGTNGARTIGDAIFDNNSTTSTNIKRGNITYYSKVPFFRATPATFTGSTSQTAQWTRAYAAGTLNIGQGWKIRHSGLTSGAGGTKTVAVLLNATVVAVTLTVPSGTSSFSFDGIIAVGNSPNVWTYDFTVNIGGVVTRQNGTFTHAYAGSTTMGVYYTLASSGDSIVSHLVEFAPIEALQQIS
jgi:hypothetical protein